MMRGCDQTSVSVDERAPRRRGSVEGLLNEEDLKILSRIAVLSGDYFQS